MWNRKYVKLQGTAKHRSSTGSESWILGICIIMEELPTGNFWALPIVPVAPKRFTDSLWDSWSRKAWQHGGDGCAQASKTWRSCSSLSRWARALWRYNKLLWFGSGFRACRKKHCSCIPKTNVHVYYDREQIDDVSSLTTAMKYFHVMHIHPPHRWEVMLRSDTMDKGNFLSEEFSKTQKCSPNCSNIRECKVQQGRCKMEIKEGIMSFAEQIRPWQTHAQTLWAFDFPHGRKLVQFS